MSTHAEYFGLAALGQVAAPWWSDILSEEPGLLYDTAYRRRLGVQKSIGSGARVGGKVGRWRFTSNG